MIAENLTVIEFNASRTVGEPNGHCHHDVFKEDECVIINFSHFFVNFLIERLQEVGVSIALIHNFPPVVVQISEEGLIQELVADDVGFVFEFRCDQSPKIREGVCQPLDVCVQVLEGLADVVREVVLGKGDVEAILNDRVAELVSCDVGANRVGKGRV